MSASPSIVVQHLRKVYGEIVAVDDLSFSAPRGAVLGLLGVKSTMGSVRGRWQQFRGIPVMPTFHPSYLLRAEDGADRGHAEKRKTWEDMLLVLERLQHPVTDRMRGFFLKPPA